MVPHVLWAAQIAAATPLPDRRLTYRFAVLLDTFAQQPDAAIPQACGSWANTKATYRFLDNDRITAAALLAGTARATADRCANQPVILVPQDTTSFNLTHCQQVPELGPIDSAGLARGLLLHSTLALTVTGEMLGVLDLQTWVRTPPEQPKGAEKESGKWLTGIERAREALLSRPGPRPRLIHLMDREGDFWDVLQTLDDLGDSAIIRCAQDRCLNDTVDRAHAAVRAQPVLGRATLAVPRSHGQPARTATVELRSLPAVLQPDREKYPHGEVLWWWSLVEVWEPEPPPGQTGLHWRLWTLEPATTAAEVLEVARKYTCRWPAEEYHLAFKSGCRFEAKRLGSWSSWEKAVVLYANVAARIVSLRDAAEQRPEQAATALLSVEECAVLVGKFGPVVDGGVLTVRQAVLWLGRLGGHLNRKRDGLPGVRTLWRGLEVLHWLVEGFRTAKRLLE